jgi:hypothetical protein
MITFCWLFLFPAKCIWNRASVRGQNKNSNVFWGCRSDCWLGTVPLVVSYSSAILQHRTKISSKQLVMLRWDSSTTMFVKYVTVAGKETCFPEPVCSISCCGRFQVSFPNQSSNLIVGDKSVWFYSQISKTCAWYVFRGCMRETRTSSWMLCGGKQTLCTPISRAVYHLNIPRKRVVTIQCQDIGAFFRWLQKTDKVIEPLRKVLFLDLPSPGTAATELGEALTSSSAFMLLLGNTRRGGTYVTVAFMQVTNCHEWTSVC